jgi:hypothetical protein
MAETRQNSRTVTLSPGTGSTGPTITYTQSSPSSRLVRVSSSKRKPVKRKPVLTPSTPGNLAEDLLSSNPSRVTNAYNVLKSMGISDPQQYDKISLVKALRDSSKESLKQKVRAQEKQRAYERRVRELQEKLDKEGRRPTSSELRSLRGGLAGLQDEREFRIQETLDKQAQLKRIKESQLSKLGPRISNLPTIPESELSLIPRFQESKQPRGYVRDLRQQQALEVAKKIPLTREQEKFKERITRGEIQPVEIPKFSEIKSDGLLISSPRLDYEIRKLELKGETKFERESAKRDVLSATGVMLPLFASRTGKTAFRVATAPIRKSTYVALKDLAVDLNTGGERTIAGLQQYGADILRLPYILPADIAGIYLGRSIIKFAVKKAASKLQQFKSKAKVEVPKTREGAVIKTIEQTPKGTKATLKSMIPSEQTTRVRFTKVPKHLSGKNVLFESPKDIPKGYVFTKNAPGGKVFAQKIIQSYTRTYNVEPQSFKISGEEFRVALKTKEGVISTDKTLPQEFYFNPKTSKFELVKTKPYPYTVKQVPKNIDQLIKQSEITYIKPQDVSLKGVGGIYHSETGKITIFKERIVESKTTSMGPFEIKSIKYVKIPGKEIKEVITHEIIHKRLIESGLTTKELKTLASTSGLTKTQIQNQLSIFTNKGLSTHDAYHEILAYKYMDKPSLLLKSPIKQYFKIDVQKTIPSSRISTFTQEDFSKIFKGEEKTLQIAGTGKIETVKYINIKQPSPESTKYIFQSTPTTSIIQSLKNIKDPIEQITQIETTSKLKPILSVVEPKVSIPVILPVSNFLQPQITVQEMPSTLAQERPTTITSRTRLNIKPIQKIKPTLDIKPVQAIKPAISVKTKQTPKTRLALAQIQAIKPVQAIKPALKIKSKLIIRPIIEGPKVPKIYIPELPKKEKKQKKIKAKVKITLPLVEYTKTIVPARRRRYDIKLFTGTELR